MRTLLLLLVLGTLLPATAFAGNATYTYDSQGRLVKAVYVDAAGTRTVVYTYDAAGNRQTVTIS